MLHTDVPVTCKSPLPYLNFNLVKYWVFFLFQREINYTCMLVFSIIVCVIGNSFLYGYNIGVINNPSGVSLFKTQTDKQVIAIWISYCLWISPYLVRLSRLLSHSHHFLKSSSFIWRSTKVNKHKIRHIAIMI